MDPYPYSGVRLASKAWKPVERITVPTSMVSCRASARRLMAWRSPQASTQVFLHFPDLNWMHVSGSITGQRHGLREGNVDGLAFPQAHVELVGNLGLLVYAGLDAIETARAEVFIHVARTAVHLHLVAAHEAIHLGDFRVGPQGDVGVGAHADILGVRMQAAQSRVGKVLSNLAMCPPMVASRSTGRRASRHWPG